MARMPPVDTQCVKSAFDINPKPARLMTDIYALALRAPSRALNIIKYWISKNLRKVIRDINLREILAVCTDRAHEEFCETLFLASPCYVKVLSAAYQASPFALIDDLLAIFESTQTMFQFLALGRSVRFARVTLQKASR